MSDEQVSTWYRSMDENGFLICESSSLYEVLAMSKGMNFVLQNMTRRVVVSKWKSIDANEVVRMMQTEGI